MPTSDTRTYEMLVEQFSPPNTLVLHGEGGKIDSRKAEDSAFGLSGSKAFDSTGAKPLKLEKGQRVHVTIKILDSENVVAKPDDEKLPVNERTI